MKGLKADIWGEIFEHFMTLQNLYKMFSDPPGILRKNLLQVHINPSNEIFNGTFYLSLDFICIQKDVVLKIFFRFILYKNYLLVLSYVHLFKFIVDKKKEYYYCHLLT